MLRGSGTGTGVVPTIWIAWMLSPPSPFCMIQPRAWAQEQVRPLPNRSLNNLSNVPLRNIDAGLDPKLPELSRVRFD